MSATYMTKPRTVQAVQVIDYYLQMGGEMLLPEWARRHCEVLISGSFGANVKMIVSTARGRVAAFSDMWIVKDGEHVSVLTDAEFQRVYEESKQQAEAPHAE